MAGWLRRLMGGERRSAHPRDPALAALFGIGSQTQTGVHVTPSNARDCPEVDACVRLIEDTVATLPLDLFARTADGSRERLSDHPLHALLHDRPNAWQTSAEFRQMMEGWRSTEGNAYARIVANGVRGFPQALEPIHPAEMRPFRTPSGGVAYRWTPPSGPAQTLLQGEVLHLRDTPADPHNMLAGSSRVMRHREAVGRAMAVGEYLSRFFGNGAKPPLVIEVPGTPDRDLLELLREQWEQRQGGLRNINRVGFMMAGMKLHELAASNADHQVIEAYNLAVAQLARIWGIPLHLIGEMSKSTSWGTGIEQQSIGFVVYYMRPKLVIWEQALNLALMSPDARRQMYFEFNVDGLLRGDFKTRMEGYGLLVQWGLMSPNEIRRQMNLAPLPGGDERLQPLNMAPASRIMEVLLRGKSGAGERDAADQATRMLAAMADAVAGANQEN